MSTVWNAGPLALDREVAARGVGRSSMARAISPIALTEFAVISRAFGGTRLSCPSIPAVAALPARLLSPDRESPLRCRFVSRQRCLRTGATSIRRGLRERPIFRASLDQTFPSSEDMPEPPDHYFFRLSQLRRFTMHLRTLVKKA